MLGPSGDDAENVDHSIEDQLADAKREHDENQKRELHMLTISNARKKRKLDRMQAHVDAGSGKIPADKMLHAEGGYEGRRENRIPVVAKRRVEHWNGNMLVTRAKSCAGDRKLSHAHALAKTSNPVTGIGMAQAIP